MYKRIKKAVHDIIEPRKNLTLMSKLFDWFIITVIAVNILLIILSTFRDFPPEIKAVLKIIETVSIIIFTVEYILRVWVSDLDQKGINPIKARIRYIFSFMALIDLAAFLPYWLPFVFIDLRILRGFSVLRVLKINRYTYALRNVANAIKIKSSQIISSVFVVLVSLIIVSVLMYNIENAAQPENFENAFDSMWWAVNALTTVGYGDIYPVTVLGKILGSLLALLGVALVAIPTGIISAGFIESSDKRKKPDKTELNQQLLEVINGLKYNNGMDISVIGKQIARGRKEKGLSQAKLAEMVAVTPQAVSKWERAESLPDIFMLARISYLLDIYDVGYFLGQEPACPCGFCDCEKNLKEGKTADGKSENFTTIEQFTEYWQSCSLMGLQKIAQKYEVAFNKSDTKETLVKKLTDEMNNYCNK